MAARSLFPYFGANVYPAPTDADLAAMSDFNNAIGGAPRDQYASQPTPVQTIVLDIPTVSASSTGDSIVWSPPFPVEILGVQAGSLTAAGATGTIDLQRQTNGTGGYSSMLEAAIDVKTVGATFSAVTGPTDDPDEYIVLTTDQLKAVGASGSGGTLTGGKLVVYYRQLSTDDRA